MPLPKKLLNSELTDFRHPPTTKSEIKGGATIKFENKEGDVMVFTPAEARHVLSRYIHEELELYSDATVTNVKSIIEARINTNLKQIEEGLEKLIIDKIDKITENIVSKIIDRVVNEEVNKRLDIKLKQIKDSL